MSKLLPTKLYENHAPERIHQILMTTKRRGVVQEEWLYNDTIDLDHMAKIINAAFQLAWLCDDTSIRIYLDNKEINPTIDDIDQKWLDETLKEIHGRD